LGSVTEKHILIQIQIKKPSDAEGWKVLRYITTNGGTLDYSHMGFSKELGKFMISHNN
jgi:hypothetical protein